MIIKNGVGDGTLARVFENHLIGTQSCAEPAMGYKSRVEAQGFSMFLPAVYPIPASECCVMVIYNGESEKSFILNSLYISHNGGATFNRSITAKMYKNATAPTTGIYGGVPINFGNLNFGSSKITDVKAYLWDGSTGTGLTGGSAGSIAMVGVFPPTFTHVELSGSVVITPGQYVRFTYEGAVALGACLTISGYLSTSDKL